MIKKIVKKKEFTLVVLLLLINLVLGILGIIFKQPFFSMSTYKNILISLPNFAFLSIGAGCLLIGGNMDLAASTVGCFSGVIIANLYHLGVPWFLCIIIALIVSCIFGFIDGTLVTKYRMPAFIATLGVSYVVRGISYLFSAACAGGQAGNMNFKSEQIQWIAKYKPVAKLPVIIFIMFVLFIIYGILISKTRFGMKMKLVGGNPEAARLAGINSRKIAMILFINCNFCAGLAGWYNAAKTGQGALTALSTAQFTGLTAAIIGGISFGGGEGGMFGAFIGLLILQSFQVGMNILGINPYFYTTFSGLLLIIALGVDFITARGKVAVKPKAKAKEVRHV
ncbi:MAG: ABC transporter permease [Oscillospiraceae bacterium]|nr:ABC transporter permease [Oscillospiraceae bacterium]